MPNYKGHLVGGVVTYVFMLKFLLPVTLSLPVILQGFIFTLLGSLFPDIDTKSKGQMIFYKVLLLFLLYSLFLQRWDIFATSSLFGILPLLVRHRGLFHQVWFLLLLVLALIIGIKNFYKEQIEVIYMLNLLFFFIGSLSHIFLDKLFTWLKRKGH